MENIIELLKILEKENEKFLEISKWHWEDKTYNLGEIAKKLLERQPSQLEIILEYTYYTFLTWWIFRLIYEVIQALK